MAVSVGVAVELALVVVVVVLGAGQRKPHAQVDSERLVKPRVGSHRKPSGRSSRRIVQSEESEVQGPGMQFVEFGGFHVPLTPSRMCERDGRTWPNLPRSRPLAWNGLCISRSYLQMVLDSAITRRVGTENAPAPTTGLDVTKSGSCFSEEMDFSSADTISNSQMLTALCVCGKDLVQSLSGSFTVGLSAAPCLLGSCGKKTV